jgi:hypothetical protein
MGMAHIASAAAVATLSSAAAALSIMPGHGGRPARSMFAGMAVARGMSCRLDRVVGSMAAPAHRGGIVAMLQPRLLLLMSLLCPPVAA